ncbi:MAG: hypothetical protein KA015_05170 [Spirochaetes bacterium]|nr:hypothetical protein [Spirochaetota bacterium]
MKKYFVILFLFISNICFASDYKAALGVRLEAGKHGNHGLSYKYFFAKPSAVELMALSDLDYGIEFHAFYIFQNNLPGASSEFQWYAGAGGHLGIWEKDTPVAGPDGLIGLEYRFKQIPLALSLDWHPLFNIITKKDDRFFPLKFGLTARYCF